MWILFAYAQRAEQALQLIRVHIRVIEVHLEKVHVGADSQSDIKAASRNNPQLPEFV